MDRDISQDFKDRMEKGIYLKDLDTTTGRCKVLKEGDRTFRIILTQGLNRQIRRMCESLGYKVESLLRTRVVNITIDGLEPGQYRYLTDEEISGLCERLKMSSVHKEVGHDDCRS